MKKIRSLLVVCVISLTFLGALKNLASAQQNIPSLIKKVQPSVVLITAYDTIGNKSSQGSGFFISQKGEVITNWHVVSDTTFAMVKTTTGAIYEVIGVKAKDEKRDIVKLVLAAKDISFSYLRLSPSLPSVGEQILVIGSPHGLESTVSDGLVSGLRKIPDIGNVIQISAPISQGSSGGPVINLKGEVVGIASFQLIEGQNLNFAYSAKDIAQLFTSDSQTITPLSLIDTYESRFKAANRYVQIAMSPMVDSILNEVSKKLPVEKRDEYLIRIRDFINNKFVKKTTELMIKHYTVDELNALADFYDRPMGKSILEKFGPLMVDVQAYIPEMLKELKEAMINEKSR